jgi:hypothetical protein
MGPQASNSEFASDRDSLTLLTSSHSVNSICLKSNDLVTYPINQDVEEAAILPAFAPSSKPS